MLKRISALFIGLIMVASPAFAFATTSTDNTSQLVSLYTRLIQLLQKELVLLQNPGGVVVNPIQNPPQSATTTSLSIYPHTGVAPLFVTFIVNNPTDYESISFGNGPTTGSNGCPRNTEGWCDLTKPVANKYPVPGIYTVLLYQHTSSTTIQNISTSTITVTAPSI